LRFAFLNIIRRYFFHVFGEGKCEDGTLPRVSVLLRCWNCRFMVKRGTSAKSAPTQEEVEAERDLTLRITA